MFTKVYVGKSQEKEVDWGGKKKKKGRNMEILEEEERLFDDFFGTQERIASSVMALCWILCAFVSLASPSSSNLSYCFAVV